jgi:hypothetical protein
MFRFTIRDVLWLMALIGLALAWLVSYRLTEPRQLPISTSKLVVRLGHNQFEAEGNSEIVKEQYSLFLNAVYPPPPEPVVAGGGMTAGGSFGEGAAGQAVATPPTP